MEAPPEDVIAQGEFLGAEDDALIYQPDFDRISIDAPISNLDSARKGSEGKNILQKKGERRKKGALNNYEDFYLDEGT